MSSNTQRVAIGTLLVALTVAVGVQSYFLYRLHAKLDARAAAEVPGSDLADPSAEPPPRSGPKGYVDSFDPLGWDPFREMEDMRARIDDLFAASLGRFDLETEVLDDLGFPRADLTEEGDEYVIRVDVPGADETSFDVSVDDRSLVIQSDTSQETREEEPGSLLRRERRVVHFQRSPDSAWTGRLGIPDERLRRRSPHGPGAQGLAVRGESASPAGCWHPLRVGLRKRRQIGARLSEAKPEWRTGFCGRMTLTTGC